MTQFMQRCLAVGLLVVAVGLTPPPSTVLALPAAAPEPVFGSATATMDDEGDMRPTGNGRFTIDDRVYEGKSIGRSVGGRAAACFTGTLRSEEEWALESPRMIGTHESTVTIKSEQGSLTLRLRGEMERLTASGRWEIVRSSGACETLDGEGQYTAEYSSEDSGPHLRLTFDGETQA